jgi:cell fate (sporulation/competence/biofilm development) regulator YlbF (YheA/YmcA/DUF963 family)
MTDLSNLCEEVVKRIRDTEEYRAYREIVDELKKDEKLYARVCDLREKSFMIQMENPPDAMDRLDSLTNEYEDVINIELVGRFLNAEASFCRMMQDYNGKVSRGLEFD